MPVQEQEYEPGPRRTKRSEHMGDESLFDWQQGHRRVMGQHRDDDSPWTQRLESDLTNDAEMVHEQTRTEQAQNADESFNAPIAETYNQWLRQPNRYDLVGVDTIPHERRVERAERVAAAAERVGALDEVVYDSPDQSASQPAAFIGRGRGDTILETSVQIADEDVMERVRERDHDVAWNTLGPYLAHEVGHSLDHFFGPGGYSKAGYASESFIEDHREQFEGTSIRLRGYRGRPDYQFSHQELAADAFASYTLEPRALRRAAPDVYQTIDEQFGQPLRGRVGDDEWDDLEDDI